MSDACQAVIVDADPVAWAFLRLRAWEAAWVAMGFSSSDEPGSRTADLRTIESALDEARKQGPPPATSFVVVSDDMVNVLEKFPSRPVTVHIERQEGRRLELLFENFGESE